MAFFTEPDHYQQTILSELQGAWECLRDDVVKHAGFRNWDRLLFHIDEAMSWETVRHLDRMESPLPLIRNLAAQGEAPGEIMEAIEDIADILQEVRQDLKQGKPSPLWSMRFRIARTWKPGTVKMTGEERQGACLFPVQHG